MEPRLKFKLLASMGVIMAIVLPYFLDPVFAQVDNGVTSNSTQQPEETFAPLETRPDPLSSTIRLIPFIAIAAIVAAVAVVFFVLWRQRHKRV